MAMPAAGFALLVTPLRVPVDVRLAIVSIDMRVAADRRLVLSAKVSDRDRRFPSPRMADHAGMGARVTGGMPIAIDT